MKELIRLPTASVSIEAFNLSGDIWIAAAAGQIATKVDSHKNRGISATRGQPENPQKPGENYIRFEVWPDIST
jgi:hypothetical protein